MIGCLPARYVIDAQTVGAGVAEAIGCSPPMIFLSDAVRLSQFGYRRYREEVQCADLSLQV
jgi:hypothetical protein